MAEISFSHSEPIPWRVIDAGLCLEGRCSARHRSCPAFQKMVIGNLQMGHFTLSRAKTFACPMCHSLVFGEKFGLNRCRWRIQSHNTWSMTGDIYKSYDLNDLPMDIEVDSLIEDSVVKDDCTICLSSMEKRKECSILPCGHVFHLGCIHEWIDADEDTSFQCPICREGIFGGETE